MSDTTLPNRIPAEDIEQATVWVLPPVADNGRVLSSAEKEARERRERLLRREQEKIEIVEMPVQEQVPQVGMTAEEMQAIFEVAEKEGFEQGHADGFAKGNTEGYEAGRQQGLKEMRAQLVAEQQRFHALANALLNPIDAQDGDLELMVLDVICTLTQSVVQREVQTDSSQILDLVREAIAALPVGSKNIRVCLNPDDLAAIETYAAEQQLEWRFLSDPQMLPGGCRIETPESRVDFSVSSRLQTVLEQFVNKQLATSDALSESEPDDEELGNDGRRKDVSNQNEPNI